jgi:hypothetical protein
MVVRRDQYVDPWGYFFSNLLKAEATRFFFGVTRGFRLQPEGQRAISIQL